MTYDPKNRTAAGARARLNAQPAPATPVVRAAIVSALAGPPTGPAGGIAERMARRLLGMDRCKCRHLTEHEHQCGVTGSSSSEVSRG